MNEGVSEILNLGIRWLYLGQFCQAVPSEFELSYGIHLAKFSRVQDVSAAGKNLCGVCHNLNKYHFEKSVHIRSYSGPHFRVFGLNTERYFVILKMRIRVTPNTDTFHAVYTSQISLLRGKNTSRFLSHFTSCFPTCAVLTVLFPQGISNYREMVHVRIKRSASKYSWVLLFPKFIFLFRYLHF